MLQMCSWRLPTYAFIICCSWWDSLLQAPFCSAVHGEGQLSARTQGCNPQEKCSCTSRSRGRGGSKGGGGGGPSRRSWADTRAILKFVFVNSSIHLISLFYLHSFPFLEFNLHEEEQFYVVLFVDSLFLIFKACIKGLCNFVIYIHIYGCTSYYIFLFDNFLVQGFN